MSEHTSAICPGQQALFQDDCGEHYLRVAVTVFYTNSSPNAETFYLTDYPLKPLTLGTIARLERDMTTLLSKEQGSTVERVAFVGYMGIQMTEADAKLVSSRLINGVGSTQEGQS